MNSEHAKRYLVAGAPFLGQSHPDRRHQLKDLGARWDSSSRCFAAPTREALALLAESGLWTAHGLDSLQTYRLGALARAAMAAAAAAAAAKKKVEDERRIAAATARAEANARAMLGVKDDEPELLELARQHGVTDAMIKETETWSQLGPRSGISNVRRVRRGITFGKTTWEEIASSEAAARMNRELRKPVKKDTGARAKKRVTQVEAAVAPAQVSQVSRDAAKRAKRGEPAVVYRPVTHCDECHHCIDSRWQFGMECHCSDGLSWKPCMRCQLPLFKSLVSYCEDCNIILRS